jgi:zinc transporter ZupT
MKEILIYGLLGLFLAFLEVLIALKTKLLDVPWAFLTFFFLLFFLLSSFFYRKKKGKYGFFISLFLYASGLLFYFALYLRDHPEFEQLTYLYYFLLYVWPGILGTVSYHLVRILLRPAPFRPTKFYRLERQLRLKAKKRKKAALKNKASGE